MPTNAIEHKAALSSGTDGIVLISLASEITQLIYHAQYSIPVALFIVFLNSSRSPSGRRSLPFSEGWYADGLALAYAAFWVGLRWQAVQLCMRTKSQWCCGVRRLGGRKVSALP